MHAVLPWRDTRVHATSSVYPGNGHGRTACMARNGLAFTLPWQPHPDRVICHVLQATLSPRGQRPHRPPLCTDPIARPPQNTGLRLPRIPGEPVPRGSPGSHQRSQRPLHSRPPHPSKLHTIGQSCAKPQSAEIPLARAAHSGGAVAQWQPLQVAVPASGGVQRRNPMAGEGLVGPHTLSRL